MKLQKIAIILLSLTVIGFVGCKKQTDKPVQSDSTAMTFDSTSLKTTLLGDDEAKDLTLRYRPAIGKTFVYRLTSIMSESGKIVADTTFFPKSSQTVTYALQVKTNEYESDSTLDVGFTVTGIKLHVDMDGKKLDYTSGEKLDSSKRDKFLEYEGLINNSFGARIKPNGEILELYKTDKIVTKLLSLRKISRDTIPQQELAAFEQSIIMSGLRPIVRQVFREFAKNQISKNNSWEIPQPPMNLQVVMFDQKAVNTLQSVEKMGSDKLANIGVKLVSKSTTNPELAKRKMSVSKSSLTGDGNLYFNLSKGMFQKNKTTMVLGMAMSGVAPTPRGLQNYSTDKTTTSTYVLELLEVK